MTGSVFCTQCGAENAPGANFCTRCGARLTAPPAAMSTGPAGPSGPGTTMPAPPPAGQGMAPPYNPPPAQAPAAAPPQAEWSAEKEPMLLLDVTGSMNYGTSAHDTTPRRDTIREAISIIVATLAAQDSQAAHEEEGEGGLRTVIFAGGQARDIGDLNPANLTQKWAQITWAGGTRIMPGWNTLLQTYMEEFGQEDPSSRPLLLALVITDGEADDTAQFAQALERATGLVYAVLAIIGYGPDHDAALQAYQAIAQTNPHVRVVTLASETDPQAIARTLLRMIE